jgi:hypothetical protein
MSNGEGDPFGGKAAKEQWLARLREGAKWRFYITQFRIATRHEKGVYEED